MTSWIYRTIVILFFFSLSFDLYSKDPFPTLTASQAKVFDQEPDWKRFFYQEGSEIGRELLKIETEIFDLRRRSANRVIDMKPFIPRLDALRNRIIEIDRLKTEVYSLGRQHIKDFNLNVRPEKFEPFTKDSGLYPNTGPYIIVKAEEVSVPFGYWLNNRIILGGSSAVLLALYHTVTGAEISGNEMTALSIAGAAFLGSGLYKYFSLSNRFTKSRDALVEKTKSFWDGETEFSLGLKDSNFLIPENITSIEDLLLFLSFRLSLTEYPEVQYSSEMTAEALKEEMRFWEARISGLAMGFSELSAPEAQRLAAIFKFANDPPESWTKSRPRLSTDKWLLKTRTFAENAEAILPWLIKMQSSVDIWSCKRAILTLRK